MALSLDKLWKDASDDAVLGSVTKWDSLNDECRRVVIAEAKRRGLALEIPIDDAVASSPSAAESVPAASPKVWLIVALAVAGVAAIGYLV